MQLKLLNESESFKKWHAVSAFLGLYELKVDMVGAVCKISALQAEGPRYDPRSAEIWIFFFVWTSFLP